ncbi:MAG TPA: glycosyltransferase family 1 protein, partial [Candidatus Rifleibacterium sp.]|nr:glycosyltransferase family 1 protein [Candidatus Rifleibacterium sp.]
TIRVIPEASGNVFKRYFWENTGLISLCQSWNADLLFCVANIIPLRNPGIPVAVMIQNVAPLTPRVLYLLKKFEPVQKYLQMLLLQKLTLYAVRNSQKVISLSQAAAGLLQKWQPSLESAVLYHGIADVFSPDVPRPKQAGNQPYFLYVSNLYVYKGFEYLVEAMALNPDLPRVMIAGRAFDQGYMRYISSLIEKFGVKDRVIFLDSLEYRDLPGWYAHATAMVSPSWCESSSIILLEAMACGCPVVAMNTGPMPEICGEVGIYAEPFSADELATAMQRATEIDRNKLREKLVARAAEFTWEKAMQDHARIFADMAKPGKSC